MPSLTPASAMRRKVSDVLAAFTLSALLWSIGKRIWSFFAPAPAAREGHWKCPFHAFSKEMRSRYTEDEIAMLHDDPHAYIPPKEGDSRAPCPALNTMANHGYISRDGKNLSGRDLANGLMACYNISMPLAYFLSYGGFYLFNNPVIQFPTLSWNPITVWKSAPDNWKTITSWPVNFLWLIRNTLLHPRVELSDFALHNHVEHDASICHEDAPVRFKPKPQASLHIDPNKFDLFAPCPVIPKMFDDFVKDSATGTHCNARDIAATRVRREAESLKARAAQFARFTMAATSDYDGLHAEIARGETALVLGIFGGGHPTPMVSFDVLRSWWVDERLPDGWRPTHVQKLGYTVDLSKAIRQEMKDIRARAEAREKAQVLQELALAKNEILNDVRAKVARGLAKVKKHVQHLETAHASAQAGKDEAAAHISGFPFVTSPLSQRTGWASTVSTSSSQESSVISVASPFSTASDKTLFPISPPLSPSSTPVSSAFSSASGSRVHADYAADGSLLAFGMPDITAPTVKSAASPPQAPASPAKTPDRPSMHGRVDTGATLVDSISWSSSTSRSRHHSFMGKVGEKVENFVHRSRTASTRSKRSFLSSRSDKLGASEKDFSSEEEGATPVVEQMPTLPKLTVEAAEHDVEPQLVVAAA